MAQRGSLYKEVKRKTRVTSTCNSSNNNNQITTNLIHATGLLGLNTTVCQSRTALVRDVRVVEDKVIASGRFTKYVLLLCFLPLSLSLSTDTFFLTLSSLAHRAGNFSVNNVAVFDLSAWQWQYLAQDPVLNNASINTCAYMPDGSPVVSGQPMVRE